MVMKFLHRNQTAPAPASESYASELDPELQLAAVPAPELAAFDGLTADRRVVGQVLLDGRLSDMLNRRELLPISDARTAPLAKGKAQFRLDPSYTSVDPYDFEIVLAGAGTLPDFTVAEMAARRVRKTSHRVDLDVAPYRVTGIIWLNTGDALEKLLVRSDRLYLPVTEAEISLGDQLIDTNGADAVLVNYLGLHGVKELGD